MQRKSFKNVMTLAIVAVASMAFTMSSSNAALINGVTYVYGGNAESQPQSATFQGGVIADLNTSKLTDGQLATGGWNDGKNVGFRNDSDNGNPQPRVTFDVGGMFDMNAIDVYTVSAFLSNTESVSVSSSTDGNSYSAPVVVNPLVWSGGFANSGLRKATVDVSSLPTGQFYQVDFFDPAQWMMINEVEFDGDAATGGNAVPEPATATLALLGLGGLMMRRRRNA